MDFTSGDSSPGRSRFNLGQITPLSNEELSSLNTIKTAMELTVGYRNSPRSPAPYRCRPWIELTTWSHAKKKVSATCDHLTMGLTTWLEVGVIEFNAPIATATVLGPPQENIFLLTGTTRRGCAFRMKNINCLRLQDRSDKTTRRRIDR